jgi:hypothetical protein
MSEPSAAPVKVVSTTMHASHMRRGDSHNERTGFIAACEARNCELEHRTGYGCPAAKALSLQQTADQGYGAGEGRVDGGPQATEVLRRRLDGNANEGNGCGNRGGGQRVRATPIPWLESGVTCWPARSYGARHNRFSVETGLSHPVFTPVPYPRKLHQTVHSTAPAASPLPSGDGRNYRH